MEPTVLREYQKEAMAYLSRFDKSAAYMEMGLGKTFIGSEMIKRWLASGTR